MEQRSRLVKMTIRNIGCFGNDGIEIHLDKVVCLVGRNNAGKSTILKAYDLVAGSNKVFNPEIDRHFSALKDQESEIILEVHIPDGIQNIDKKWKVESNGLQIVKARYQWKSPDYKLWGCSS